MSAFGDVLAAIDDFRSAVFTAKHAEGARLTQGILNLNLRGMLGESISPLQNIHAIGAGIRFTAGQAIRAEFVIKVYVFQKLEGLGALIPRLLSGAFQGIDIDIEELPVLDPRAKKAAAPRATTPKQHQASKRPVIGGLEIQPRGASIVGTLGGFVKPVDGQQDLLFALSNNHVLAGTNTLPIGREITQPLSNETEDVFAKLTNFEPIQLPTAAQPVPAANRMDAAIARVTDVSLVETGKMHGIANYTPVLKAPVPGMEVTKSGRTTAVTRGQVSAIRVNGIRVNYGTRVSPLIGTFDGCVQIVDNGPVAFSAEGDSGSLILEAATGQPVALLFAGTSEATSACDLTAVCTRFNVLPA
jgi:hypothetical protein